jgi:hypothetical protein
MPPMARAIAFSFTSGRMAEAMRIALVIGCAATLILAGEALPL